MKEDYNGNGAGAHADDDHVSAACRMMLLDQNRADHKEAIKEAAEHLAQESTRESTKRFAVAVDHGLQRTAGLNLAHFRARVSKFLEKGDTRYQAEVPDPQTGLPVLRNCIFNDITKK